MRPRHSHVLDRLDASATYQDGVPVTCALTGGATRPTGGGPPSHLFTLTAHEEGRAGSAAQLRSHATDAGRRTR